MEMADTMEELLLTENFGDDLGVGTDDDITQENFDAPSTTTEEGNVESTSAAETTDQQQPASEGSTPDAGSEPKEKEKPAKEAPKKDITNPGDLVLPDGTRIRAGAERRLYERAQQSQQHVQQLRQTVDEANKRAAEMSAELEAYRKSNHHIQSAGITPDEHAMGMQLMSAWKQNPMKVVEFLLAEARAKGYNIESVSQGADRHTLEQLLDERLKPFTEAHQAQQRQQEEQEKLANYVNNFYTQYPDARLHDQLIGQIVANNPGSDPVQVYQWLKSETLRRGLDFSQPLGPQYAALEREQQQPQTTAPAQVQPARPVPQGRAHTGAVVSQNAPRYASVDDSYDSIIDKALSENGY